MKHGKLNNERIAVIDLGGQYAHLIASKIRRLGAFSEIVSTDELQPEKILSSFRGIILSGGPSSVYEPLAPSTPRKLLDIGLPVLGICYGHQLIMHQLGGDVKNAHGKEYGPAEIQISDFSGLFAGEEQWDNAVVWMNHGDEVKTLPDGFKITGSTQDCAFASVADTSRRIYGVQFHPEVADTVRGDCYLGNFIKICGLENSWSLEDFLKAKTEEIQKETINRKVFLLISGGVDSTVAYALLSRSLPRDHLKGLLIDTGFMRKNEINEVKKALAAVEVDLDVHDASPDFYEKLGNVFDPEEKRRIIGDQFLKSQETASEKLFETPGDWMIGQGTIYPDTIESGGTKHSHKIKTHHNRVPKIQELIQAGRIIEPVRDLYKDEVRRLGELLGLPDSLVHRHPFPGPGLAVRCLCSDGSENSSMPIGDFINKIENKKNEASDICDQLIRHSLEGLVLPLQSVGVQGDQRSFARPAALLPLKERPSWETLEKISRAIPNYFSDFNRVLIRTGAKNPGGYYRRVPNRYLTPDRIDTLREADSIVTDFLREKNIYSEIWQFPVVIVPVVCGKNQAAPTKTPDSDAETAGPCESIILRPVNSRDAMTASVYRMNFSLIDDLTNRLLKIETIDSIFYDLTSKPPGTIEWE